MNSVKNQIEVTRNSYKDEGEGVVSFENGLCISDSNTQRNGTRYDIESLDISKYGGQLTADHEDKLKNIIGRVEGVEKKNGRITINKIVYAVKQNPYARLAYDLLVGGFSNAFSTETIGPTANSTDGTLANHELVGLSQVVCPNNYSAVINTVHNSLERAKEDGLDIDGVEETFLNSIKAKEENSMTKIKNDAEVEKVEEVVENEEVVETPEVENTPEAKESESPEVEEAKNEAFEAEEPGEEMDKIPNKAKKDEDEEETEGEPEEEAEVEIEDVEVKEPAEEESEESEEDEEDDKKKKAKNEISDKQVKDLFAKIDNLTEIVSKVVEVDPVEKGVEEIVKEDLNAADEKEDNEINKEEPEMNKEEIQNAIQEALKGYFANDAAAPEFKKAENAVDSDYASLDWKERYGKQVNAAWSAIKGNDIAAFGELRKINQVNFDALKEAGIVTNAMTIDSMGNFVIPPEMYREIVGQRTDYSAILNATSWRETNSLEYAWLERNGDIDMKNVAMCDDGNDGNLKPMSEYAAEPQTEKLEELAAVTVVCNAATRFFAVDLLADVAAGYRNDYDRKRAQLVIAKLEEAVDKTGNEVAYAPTTDTEAMVAWLEAIAEISDTTTNGALVFNNKSFAQLKAHALEAGVEGPLSHIFADGELPQIFGTPYIVVPNDLMPTIESEDVIKYQINGKDVTIDHAVFYADLSEFVGFTSGGLQYDLATEAAYEVNGVVKSAYQRNELVLRGSFFRGGAIKDKSRVSGILQQGKTPAES